jgi:hypothetical protein
MKRTAALLALALAAGAVWVSPVSSLYAEDKPAAAATEEGFVSIFDGKTLDGWDGNPKFWSVKDGCITGETTKENPTDGNTFIRYTKGEPSNFELRFKFKIVGGNSGVQYRSKQADAKDKYRIGGYQADFEAGTTYSGILYEERGRGILCQRGKKTTLTADGKKNEEALPMTSEQLQASIKKEDWNDYTIIADGTRLTHKINGNVTSETIDESGKGATAGILALQLHAGPPMVVQFKDLRLKELPAK